MKNLKILRNLLSEPLMLFCSDENNQRQVISICALLTLPDKLDAKVQLVMYTSERKGGGDSHTELAASKRAALGHNSFFKRAKLSR